MQIFRIKDIPVIQKSDTPLIQLADIGGLSENGLDIEAGRIRAQINQCPKCIHCCRNTSGEIWKLVAQPWQVNVYHIGKKGGETTEWREDNRYSTFCTVGTDIDPIQDSLNTEENGSLQIIPAAAIGLRGAANHYKCQLNLFTEA